MDISKLPLSLVSRQPGNSHCDACQPKEPSLLGWQCAEKYFFGHFTDERKVFFGERWCGITTGTMNVILNLLKKTSTLSRLQQLKAGLPTSLSHSLKEAEPETKYAETTLLKSCRPSIREEDYCKFCLSNGEPVAVYKSHSLRSFNHGKKVVSCPILRRLKCDICGETGDNAHTRTYCPIVIQRNNGKRPTSVAFLVTKTGRSSCGTLRCPNKYFEARKLIPKKLYK